MDEPELQEENASLRRQLAELQMARQAEREQLEQQLISEKEAGDQYAEAAQNHFLELQALKQNMVKLTKQLDDEVMRKDQAMSEAATLERRLVEAESGAPLPPPPPSMMSSSGGGRSKLAAEDEERHRSLQVSTKLMRVMDQWMRQRDLQQALLRGAHINDPAFATLAQALLDCSSLQTLDLSQNQLTMDSCSDLCQIITAAPNLCFVSLADNLFSLRCLGYFMTAIMERQTAKKLMPLDLLDLSGNEGFAAAISSSPPPSLLQSVRQSLKDIKLPANGTVMVAQVMRALWRFLQETGHPQVEGSSPDEINFSLLDKVTLRKLDGALSKIIVMPVENGQEGIQRPVTANLALMAQLDEPRLPSPHLSPTLTTSTRGLVGSKAAAAAAAGTAAAATASMSGPMHSQSTTATGGVGQRPSEMSLKKTQASSLKDPFADLQGAFDPPKEKLKTFNLKQIVTRNGTVLMNMLERLLETTEVDAFDVETDQTLLEYACNTGNTGLAKLCYRRGAKLEGRTRKGDTPFNIVTRNKRYDMMEFLHTYGVKVNSCDKDGLTALHIAARNDDVDGICRLVEWGADVNIRDNRQQTPIHVAAAVGNIKSCMLLLEVGADMNAKDDRLYTAAAHANMNSHFSLFDRLTQLGGRRHGQLADQLQRSASAKRVGELIIGSGKLKSSPLGRIGKIPVNGFPGPIKPTLTLDRKN